jgi:hypothetical protein
MLIDNDNGSSVALHLEIDEKAYILGPNRADEQGQTVGEPAGNGER